MNEFGLHDTPVVMAGGVWCLREWEEWLDNPRSARSRSSSAPPAADQGEPDLRRLEAAAADAEGGRRLLNRFRPPASTPRR
ncbi:MAG: hypothetical protein M5U08_13925 [Burkholderiales bacterium]|nr:hypothetical protein [Burkholderiales bacterium]